MIDADGSLRARSPAAQKLPAPAALAVSSNTVAHRIKQIFARLDTHGRQLMAGRALGRPRVPH